MYELLHPMMHKPQHLLGHPGESGRFGGISSKIAQVRSHVIYLSSNPSFCPYEGRFLRESLSSDSRYLELGCRAAMEKAAFTPRTR